MSRLTTNKPVSEMSMLELAYNSCINKDAELVYRDFEKEVSARDFIRKVWSTYYGSPLSDDDDSLDYELMEMLSENPIYSAAGLIALLYRFMWTNADLRGELKHFEDLAEQGRLLRLPVAVGTKLYHVIEDSVAEPQIYISEHEIKDVSKNAVYAANDWWMFEEMKECNAFLSREEAEKALEKMREKV